MTVPKIHRFLVIDLNQNRIVAECGGTHDMLDRACNRLDRRHRGRTFVYDDVTERDRYLPQQGPSIRLGV